MHGKYEAEKPGNTHVSPTLKRNLYIGKLEFTTDLLWIIGWVWSFTWVHQVFSQQKIVGGFPRIKLTNLWVWPPPTSLSHLDPLQASSVDSAVLKHTMFGTYPGSFNWEHGLQVKHIWADIPRDQHLVLYSVAKMHWEFQGWKLMIKMDQRYNLTVSHQPMAETTTTFPKIYLSKQKKAVHGRSHSRTPLLPKHQRPASSAVGWHGSTYWPSPDHRTGGSWRRNEKGERLRPMRHVYLPRLRPVVLNPIVSHFPNLGGEVWEVDVCV